MAKPTINQQQPPVNPPGQLGMMTQPTSQMSNFSSVGGSVVSDFGSEMSNFSTTDSLMGDMFKSPTDQIAPYKTSSQPPSPATIEDLSLPAGYDLPSKPTSDQDVYDQMNAQTLNLSLSLPSTYTRLSFLFLTF
jgi:hypothetical protein